jgi:hypothetical protein
MDRNRGGMSKKMRKKYNKFMNSKKKNKKVRNVDKMGFWVN